MNPYLAAALVLPCLLGIIVLLRVLWGASKIVRQGLRESRLRKSPANIVPLLDEPFPCPSCARLDLVHVARSDFREMPYVEHFNCHACGTQFLGPNQEKMVAKRLEARRKLADILSGRVEKPKPADKQ